MPSYGGRERVRRSYGDVREMRERKLDVNEREREREREIQREIQIERYR
jgi:zinc finger CCCH domain-containing protein 13